MEKILTSLLTDSRLEDAFKRPVTDKTGYAESIPAIWASYSYGKRRDGLLILSDKSAKIKPRLYSKYLDEPAIVWDELKKKLFLYIPNPDFPKMAFKGSAWQTARKIKLEYFNLSLEDVYKQLMGIE